MEQHRAITGLPLPIGIFRRFLPPSSHQGFMTVHAEYPLRCPRIFEVLYFPFAIPTPEAAGAKGLVAGENGEILDLILACAAAVCAVVTDE